jgi:hypothetical protein
VESDENIEQKTLAGRGDGKLFWDSVVKKPYLFDAKDNFSTSQYSQMYAVSDLKAI